MPHLLNGAACQIELNVKKVREKEVVDFDFDFEIDENLWYIDFDGIKTSVLL